MNKYKQDKKEEILNYLENHTWRETQSKFGVSRDTLNRWKNGNGKNVVRSENIDTQILKSMKSIFDEMWDNLSVSNQKKIMKKYQNDIPKILEVLT